MLILPGAMPTCRANRIDDLTSGFLTLLHGVVFTPSLRGRSIGLVFFYMYLLPCSDLKKFKFKKGCKV